MMAFAVSALVLLEGSRPRAGAHRLRGKLMEGLTQEFRTSPAKVDPIGFPILLTARDDGTAPAGELQRYRVGFRPRRRWTSRPGNAGRTTRRRHHPFLRHQQPACTSAPSLFQSTLWTFSGMVMPALTRVRSCQPPIGPISICRWCSKAFMCERRHQRRAAGRQARIGFFKRFAPAPEALLRTLCAQFEI